MRQADIAIFLKISKKEWDQRTWRMDDFELMEAYRHRGLKPEKIERIFASDRRQKKALSDLLELLGKVSVIRREPEEWQRDPEEAADDHLRLCHTPLIIALGGDETFKYAARFRRDHLILGLNSDPGPSKGKLLWGTVDDLRPHIKRLWSDGFEIENRVRLAAYLDDQFLGLASDQVFLGADDPEVMSRYVIQLPDGRSEEQKSSGIIVATGSGSTGWHRSARYSTKFDFARSSPEARFFVREPYREDDDSTFELITGSIQAGEALQVHSLHARGGRISLDCEVHRDMEGKPTFNDGTHARIVISDSPLRVVKF